MLGNNGYIGRNPGDSAVTVARRVYKPTTDTTEFDFSAGYDIEYFDVYVNGLKKVRGTDYSASSDNKTFTLTSAAGSGDVVEAVAYKAFNVTRDSIGQVDGEIFLGDNKKVHLGNSNDFQFFHDPTFTQLDASGSSISGGTASVMQDDGTGPIVFKTNAADGQGAFQFFDKLWRPKLKIFSGPTEGVNLYHGSDTSDFKISTRPYGVKVLGITSSTTFYAQGASGISTFKGKVSLGSSVFDSNGGTGTDEQVLISVPGVGVSWANNSGGSGGGGITVQDEGNPLATVATKLNFTGSGVVASGTGATKTITISGGGSGTVARSEVSASTGSIAADATADITITGGKTYSLLKIAVDAASWVRLYTDTTSRTNDASRAYTTDPTPGSGVIAEVRTETTGSTTFLMSPAVMGWNDDSTPSANIYAKVTNNESSSADITVTLTIVELEG